MNHLSKHKRRFIAVCMVVPVILLLCFVVYPMLDMIRMSFTDWDGISQKQNFIGLKNYMDMLTKSSDLWLSLRNNLVYFVFHLLFIPIELMIASMLNTKFLGEKFFKSVTFLPYILNGVAIAYTFAYFFSPINGGLNSILELFGLEIWIQNWLADVGIVNQVLASVSVWRFSGYHIILFIAAMQSIPKEFGEAAMVDGANAVQIFRYIQLPSIQLVIDFVLFTNVTGALQTFDLPFVMTAGGPGYASSTFTLYTINTAFKFNSFGMAATMAVAMILLIVLIYGGQRFIVKAVRKERV